MLMNADNQVKTAAFHTLLDARDRVPLYDQGGPAVEYSRVVKRE